MSNAMLSGSIVALVTPMNPAGEIDWSALERLVAWQLESGSNGFVPVGTTGESATLTSEEHMGVIGRVINIVSGQVPVIAGTGSNATAEAVHQSQKAERLGADACLIVTPYYNKPSQEGLYQHYKVIAASCGLPIVLYNVPSRTACDLQPETAGRLASIANIIGIKEACGDVSRIADLRRLCPDDFILLSGEDAQTLEMLRLGAEGTISVTANVLPRQMSEFCRAFLNGDLHRAEELDAALQPAHQMLFVETSPAPVKWALHALDRIDSGIRLPLVPLSEHRRHEVMAAIAQAQD